jgi:hypothetical protein
LLGVKFDDGAGGVRKPWPEGPRQGGKQRLGREIRTGEPAVVAAREIEPAAGIGGVVCEIR